jgi:flagellar motility protein MotE (MotC chaperone)
MIRLLQSSWLAALIGCLTYLAATLALLPPARFAGVRAVLEQAQNPEPVDEVSWKFHNAEFDQWVEEIRRQREALALREQQLQELQTRIESERQELNYATQTVSQLQAEFDRNVVRIKDQEAENLKRQAKVLANMSPDSAAGLVNDMAEDEAVRILFTMKPDEASAVLEALSKIGRTEARRAAAFTERMRRALPPETSARAKTSS